MKKLVIVMLLALSFNANAGNNLLNFVSEIGSKVNDVASKVTFGDRYNVKMVTSDMGTFLEKKKGYQYKSLEECNKKVEMYMRVKAKNPEVWSTLINVSCVKTN